MKKRLKERIKHVTSFAFAMLVTYAVLTYPMKEDATYDVIAQEPDFSYAKGYEKELSQSERLKRRRRRGKRRH